MKHPLLTLLITGVGVASLVACTPAPDPSPEPTRAVRTVTVVRQEAVSAQEYAASVQARTESRLGFRVGGKLIRRLVNLGDPIKQGQILAEIDPRDLKLGQEAAQATVGAAQITVNLARADLQRFQNLRDQGFISAAELERRTATLKSAQAQLEQARAQARVQSNLATYSTLAADSAGVVTAVEAEPGAVLAPGTPVVRVAHDGPRDVVFSVPEDQVDDIRALIGKTGAILVRPWGAGAQSVAAAIREVGAAADPVTRTFLVKADIGDAPLRLGQSAVAIVAGRAPKEAIKLPLAAVLQSKGNAAVWILDPATMSVRQQKVEIAGAEGNNLVVASGLQAGQEVVTAGVHVLTPGQVVRRYADVAPVSAASDAGGTQ